MNPSTAELIKRLKQLVVNQKASHPTPPQQFPQLEMLHELIRTYDEHLSRLVFPAFRGEGRYSPFPGLDALRLSAAKALEADDPPLQRAAGVYLRYKDQLDAIDALLRQILAPDAPKEAEDVN